MVTPGNDHHPLLYPYSIPNGIDFYLTRTTERTNLRPVREAMTDGRSGIPQSAVNTETFSSSTIHK